MFLRNKKTGEVIEWDKNLTYKLDREYTSLKELCENYEDCEAPKPETWEPRVGEVVWTIAGFSKAMVFNKWWANDDNDMAALAIGNVFRTEEEAEKALGWLKARKVLFDDTKGFKPNWENATDPKWVVYYEVWSGEARNGQLCTEWGTGLVYPGPHFATAEDARASIKAHEKEWKIYLGVEE